MFTMFYSLSFCSVVNSFSIRYLKPSSSPLLYTSGPSSSFSSDFSSFLLFSYSDVILYYFETCFGSISKSSLSPRPTFEESITLSSVSFSCYYENGATFELLDAEITLGTPVDYY